MDLVDLPSAPINVATLLSQMTDPSAGGTACFIGSTRSSHRGKEVSHLQYEAYESMAIRELRNLCEVMRQRWPLKSIALVHRTGIVPVAEVSVLVAASAVHRTAALEAVSFGIDAIKTKVPIWKKEQYNDGSCSWITN